MGFDIFCFAKEDFFFLLEVKIDPFAFIEIAFLLSQSIMFQLYTPVVLSLIYCFLSFPPVWMGS